MKVYPSQEYLNSILDYRDGHLYNKVRRSVKATVGKRTDYSDSKELIVSLNGIIYMASRIVYIMHFGEIPKGYEVDHRDCNPFNNCPDNLRLATHLTNQYNKTKYRNNASGYKGVYWYRYTSKWCARIVVNKHCIALGYYYDIKDAAAAYATAAEKYHKEFARY
jgi:hypothetical protein